jgi:superfamily II DNA/RNA helicase
VVLKRLKVSLLRLISCHLCLIAQVLMFSATMKRRIETFAREILKNEVKITVGKPGQANADIQQRAEIFSHDSEKLHWLRGNIDEFAADGKVLIFVLSKAGTEEVTAELKALFARRQLQIGVDCLHGDKDQAIRTRIMQQFCRPSDRCDTFFRIALSMMLQYCCVTSHADYLFPTGITL